MIITDILKSFVKSIVCIYLQSAFLQNNILHTTEMGS